MVWQWALNHGSCCAHHDASAAGGAFDEASHGLAPGRSKAMATAFTGGVRGLLAQAMMMGLTGGMMPCEALIAVLTW
jgi:ABC-type nickel/cobalt efflux system permease component RcnA